MTLYNKGGQPTKFDKYGNLDGIDYVILNIICYDSNVTIRPVGKSSASGHQLKIKEDLIKWNTVDSVMFANIFDSIWNSDSEECFRCSDLEWSNENRTHCIAKVEEFLSYTNDVISLVVSTLCILFFLITLLILGVFVSYRDTPIVRANNKNLSFLLLVSIKLSFLSVFLFLGRPVDITCMLGNITFGITFSIAVSSLLAKTIMVCVAFKATKPGSSWRKWVGVKLSNSVVLFCSSIQIIICMTWLAISPPFQELDLHTYPGTIIIQCNEGSAIGFYSVIGYMGLLAAVSFVLAFLARTLPDSFNEAKYITFSMLLFCSVWITMIPAYLSTKGKNTVCVEIFAILTSSAGLLACIFLPKCYTILFRPVMNTIRINQRKTINSV
ncbi:vomeronasal type-2 receptor 26-like [Xenopus laevis]|uniref:Vomeronasal type-2 receptor 26-like n=1 Tax=Xenopus laevis TaxID=8355 RepID=A0A8J1MDI2_XENLA|nr:vomeronasal type-2 receptor 26-like [Xenopus laevis]